MTSAQGPITPRRGYRRWHYAPNGSWNAERIAAAMRSWDTRDRIVPAVLGVVPQRPHAAQD